MKFSIRQPIPRAFPLPWASRVFRRPSTTWLCAAAALLLCGGCLSSPEAGDEDAEARVIPGPSVRKATLYDETPLVVSEVVPDRQSDIEERELFPVREEFDVPRPPISEYPDKLIKVMDADTKVEVKFNFDATPMNEVVPLFSELLGFSYLIDPAVKGAVTMTVDSEMTAREAWELFEHILWLSGAYASRNPGFLHILPFSKMPQEKRLLIRHDPMANVEVAFLPVRHTKSAELVNNLKPFMTPGSSITDIPRLNTLLLVETPTNMPKLTELLKRLDSRGEAGWPHVCLKCHRVSAEVVVEELQSLLPIVGLPVTDKSPSNGQLKLSVVPRLQVIIASAVLPEVLEEVERWVEVLDREDLAEQENIFFYNARHSTAEHLDEMLGAFFNSSSTRSSKSSTTTKSTSSKATPAGSNPTTTRTSRTAREPESDSVFEQPVAVYADTEQNRLVIRTTQRTYAMVEALLRRLDVPQRQVAIQAYIMEVRLNESLKFGFSYKALRAKWDGWALEHGMAHTPSGLPERLKVGNGFGVLLRNPTGETLSFVEAVAGESNVEILSAPQIVAANDEEAVINVGEKVPIVKGGYVDNNNVNNNNQYTDVEYTNTGVILTVTPHITAGNQVRVAIKQEVSSAAIESDAQGILADTPTILNKTLESTLVIPDGATVLMGGLIQTKDEKVNDGIPGLKDLPLVGAAFRSNQYTEDRTELLVMLSVNVLETQDQNEQLIRRYQSALEAVRRKVKL